MGCFKHSRRAVVYRRFVLSMYCDNRDYLLGVDVTVCLDVIQDVCRSGTLTFSFTKFQSSCASRRDRLFNKSNNKANHTWDCQSVPMVVVKRFCRCSTYLLRCVADDYRPFRSKFKNHSVVWLEERRHRRVILTTS